MCINWVTGEIPPKNCNDDDGVHAQKSVVVQRGLKMLIIMAVVFYTILNSVIICNLMYL